MALLAGRASLDVRRNCTVPMRRDASAVFLSGVISQATPYAEHVVLLTTGGHRGRRRATAEQWGEELYQIMNTVVEGDLTEGDITDQKATGLKSYAWSVGILTSACEGTGIDYRESQAFSSLRGVVVRCGETLIISVRADLPEPLKITALAHELGHVARGHLYHPAPVWARETNRMFVSFVQGNEKEREADVWAAHLLVRPEVYEQYLHNACARALAEERAEIGIEALVDEAVAQTSAYLNIPVEVVALWHQTRDAALSEAAQTWLQQIRTNTAQRQAKAKSTRWPALQPSMVEVRQADASARDLEAKQSELAVLQVLANQLDALFGQWDAIGEVSQAQETQNEALQVHRRLDELTKRVNQVP